jgi:hypothetical protein
VAFGAIAPNATHERQHGGTTMKVDLSAVQALAIAPYHRPISCHLIFHFGDGVAARGFLRELAPCITMGGVDPNAKPDPLVNLGITYNGLSALEMNPALLAKFDAVFKLGPRAVNMALGDVAGTRSDPASWWKRQFATTPWRPRCRQCVTWPAPTESPSSSHARMARSFRDVGSFRG